MPRSITQFRNKGVSCGCFVQFNETPAVDSAPPLTGEGADYELRHLCLAKACTCAPLLALPLSAVGISTDALQVLP